MLCGIGRSFLKISECQKTGTIRTGLSNNRDSFAFAAIVLNFCQPCCKMPNIIYIKVELNEGVKLIKFMNVACFNIYIDCYKIIKRNGLEQFLSVFEKYMYIFHFKCYL